MGGFGVVIVYILIIFFVVFRKAKRQNGNRGPVSTNNPVGELEKTISQLAKEANAQSKKYASQQNSMGQSRPVQQPRPAQQPISQPKPKVDIVAKAKENAAKQKEDITLLELEASHGHSHEEVKKAEPHTKACDTQKKPAKASKNPNIRLNTKLDKDIDVIVPEESILGTVDDLMVKGYSGNLDFDRDFLGEALDMVANFTINGAHTSSNNFNVRKGA